MILTSKIEGKVRERKSIHILPSEIVYTDGSTGIRRDEKKTVIKSYDAQKIVETFLDQRPVGTRHIKEEPVLQLMVCFNNN